MVQHIKILVRLKDNQGQDEWSEIFSKSYEVVEWASSSSLFGFSVFAGIEIWSTGLQ